MAKLKPKRPRKVTADKLRRATRAQVTNLANGSGHPRFEVLPTPRIRKVLK